jgi:hypothetical protein
VFVCAFAGTDPVSRKNRNDVAGFTLRIDSVVG